METKGKISLIVGWITLFLMGTDLFVVSPLLPFIAQEFGISSAIAGWMVTVFAAMYALSAPFLGWLSDKKGRREFITFGLMLFVLSNVLTFYAVSFSWLIISRILAGLSVASITPLIYAIIGDIAPPNRRGTWLSIVVSGHLTALWAGAPIGSFLEHFLGWRSVFIVMGIIGAIMVIINYKTWASAPKSDSIKNVTQGNLKSIINTHFLRGILLLRRLGLFLSFYLGFSWLCRFHIVSSAISNGVSKRERQCYGME